MAQFVALVYEAGTRPDPTDPVFGEYMAGYGAFGELAGSAVVGGAPLEVAELATTVQVTGGRHGDLVLTDGPFAETKEWLGGFFVLEAADLDAAIALARHIPAAWDGGKVEVRPVMAVEMAPPG
jgi:hypothetical protein